MFKKLLQKIIPSMAFQAGYQKAQDEYKERWMPFNIAFGQTTKHQLQTFSAFKEVNSSVPIEHQRRMMASLLAKGLADQIETEMHLDSRSANKFLTEHHATIKYLFINPKDN